ncbi:MAG: DUF6660 family protein [Pyrinomonadaceae bacterium]
MRVFCFSFIVYLVLLLTQPCQDVVAQTSDCCNKADIATHIDRSTDTDSHGDDCSPFCICSCCSHPVASHKFTFGVKLDLEIAKITAPFNTYSAPDTASFTTSVWQPPKV